MTKPFIIGICGAARAGKDTAARILARELQDKNNPPERHVTIRSMADPLREMIGPIMRVAAADHSDMHDMLYGKKKEDETAILGLCSPRKLLQTLGTDWGRNMISPDIWLNIMKGRIERLDDDMLMMDMPPQLVVIIPDIRFDNEAEICDLVYCVLREDADQVREHKSERGISEKYISGYLYNSSSIRAFERRVRTEAKSIIDMQWRTA